MELVRGASEPEFIHRSEHHGLAVVRAVGIRIEHNRDATNVGRRASLLQHGKVWTSDKDKQLRVQVCIQLNCFFRQLVVLGDGVLVLGEQVPTVGALVGTVGFCCNRRCRQRSCQILELRPLGRSFSSSGGLGSCFEPGACRVLEDLVLRELLVSRVSFEHTVGETNELGSADVHRDVGLDLSEPRSPHPGILDELGAVQLAVELQFVCWLAHGVSEL